MLLFHKQVSNVNTDGQQKSTSTSQDIIAYIAERIHDLVDPTSCHVAGNDGCTAIDVKWYAACISSDTEYTDETTAALLAKFEKVVKPWDASIILEHKDATQAYLVLSTELALDSLFKNLDNATKEDDKSDASASCIDAWIDDTVNALDPAGVSSTISSIMEKDGFVQNIEEANPDMPGDF